MDISRHVEWFDPNKVVGKVMVIGVGATGSMVALELAKAGIKDITIVDDDKVECHNLANQILYGPSDIGQYKTEAAAARIEGLTGTPIHAIMGRIGAKMGKIQAPYVFICVDTMAARKEIFESCIWMGFNIKLVCDLRINAHAGQAICFEPTNLQHAQQYRAELYGDDEVQETVAGCRAPITVAATAHLGTSILMSLFINHFRGGEKIHEVLFNTNPWTITSRAFD